MSHLDEGQLHAYLDGEGTAGDGGGRQGIEQHLAECPQCRDRLEQARGIRDQARTVLRAAGPASLSALPFEAVLERAARKRARRYTIRPAVGLAWAASLGLALTVGWYARSLILVRTEAGAAAGAAEGRVQAKAIEAAPPAARQVAQAAPAPSAATPDVPRRDIANLATAEAKGVADTEARPVVEAPAPAVPSAPAMREAAGREVELRGAATVLAAQAWTTVTPAEAERRLGGPLATISGLPSLGTAVSGAGQATVARTIQVLGPGQTIELVQQHAAAPARERAAAPPAAPTAAPQAERALRRQDEAGVSVTVQWEGFSVTGRALVPADSLRKLLQRLTSPEPLR